MDARRVVLCRPMPSAYNAMTCTYITAAAARLVRCYMYVYNGSIVECILMDKCATVKFCVSYVTYVIYSRSFILMSVSLENTETRPRALQRKYTDKSTLHLLYWRTNM